MKRIGQMVAFWRIHQCAYCMWLKSERSQVIGDIAAHLTAMRSCCPSFLHRTRITRPARADVDPRPYFVSSNRHHHVRSGPRDQRESCPMIGMKIAW